MSSAILSIIIPTLNAERDLARCLESLVPGVVSELVKEAIVVDGGSTDETKLVAEGAGCRVLDAPKGRGLQLRAGAEAARGSWLLFLHADTILAEGWDEVVASHIAQRGAQTAGFFKFAFDAQGARAAIVAKSVLARCLVWNLPYGDQGLLISRDLYDALGGYPSWPLFEDVDLVDRLNRRGKRSLIPLPAKAFTAADKYERDGYFRRAAKNLWLLARYRLGAKPDALARAYR